MHDLNAFGRDVLFALAGLESPKGLDVKDKIEAYYGADINHARLYTNLDRLAEKGLVEKGRKDGRTHEYTLTHRGERELTARREWEREQVGGVAHV